ncbi:MAG: hypothetical protein Kow00124_15750 [Anaerolineae bacterium]
MQSAPRRVECCERWLLHDALIALALAGVIGLFITRFVAIRSNPLIWPGVIISAAVLYDLTLRRAWVRHIPERYRRWRCSACRATIAEDSTTCEGCGARFG